MCYQNKSLFKAKRLEQNIVKIKEQQETKKRINEFKLKQLKTMNQMEHQNPINNEVEKEFDPRDLGQMMHGTQGMIGRFHNN